jgi:thioredoxin-related protein
MIRYALGSVLWVFAGLAGANEPEPAEFNHSDNRGWLVMVTQPGCSFCVRLEREVLQPIRASKLYADTMRFTEVDIGVDGLITDFDGQSIRASEFASRYGAYGTPTLLFLTPDGAAFAEAMFGVPDTIDFFAYKIEETLQSYPN